jgi:hypothetical protein
MASILGSPYLSFFINMRFLNFIFPDEVLLLGAVKINCQRPVAKEKGIYLESCLSQVVVEPHDPFLSLRCRWKWKAQVSVLILSLWPS